MMRRRVALLVLPFIVCPGVALAAEIAITLPGDVPLTMVLIPPGTFQMGSPDDEQGRSEDEGPQHQVTISSSYYLGAREVTQDQWEAVFDNNPSYFSSCGGDCPVEKVTWWEAAAFANAVSDLEGRPNCYGLTDCTGVPGEGIGMRCDSATFVGPGCTGYRLPTEAEWERAARAGTTTRFSHGDAGSPCNDICALCALHDAHMWWCGNSVATGPTETASRQANGYGLFDMHGNVYEWVWDRYALYDGGPETDPVGPGYPDGVGRVFRGGSWSYHARQCRSAYRDTSDPNGQSASMGFRLARTADQIFADGFELGHTNAWSHTEP